MLKADEPERATLSNEQNIFQSVIKVHYCRSELNLPPEQPWTHFNKSLITIHILSTVTADNLGRRGVFLPSLSIFRVSRSALLVIKTMSYNHYLFAFTTACQ